MIVKIKTTGMSRMSSNRTKMAIKPRTIWPGSLKQITSPSRNQCWMERIRV
jgi:hypothetical protein